MLRGEFGQVLWLTGRAYPTYISFYSMARGGTMGDRIFVSAIPRDGAPTLLTSQAVCRLTSNPASLTTNPSSGRAPMDRLSLAIFMGFQAVTCQVIGTALIFHKRPKLAVALARGQEGRRSRTTRGLTTFANFLQALLSPKELQYIQLSNSFVMPNS